MKALIKTHLKTLVIATILCLLPMLFGLAMWDRLPEQMATNFGTTGEVNAYSSKAFAVFGLPLFLAAMEWLCLLASSADPRRRNLSEKVMRIILYIIPAIGLVASAITYGFALGYAVNPARVMGPLVGVLFIVIGNYLPKCRQTYTLGIKLPWTLASEENWNRTHRMAGPLWMAGGAAQLFCSLLPGRLPLYSLLTLSAVMVLAPTIYSFLLAKKQEII